MNIQPNFSFSTKKKTHLALILYLGCTEYGDTWIPSLAIAYKSIQVCIVLHMADQQRLLFSHKIIEALKIKNVCLRWTSYVPVLTTWNIVRTGTKNDGWRRRGWREQVVLIASRVQPTEFNNRDETGETGEEKNNIGIPVAYVRNAVTGQRSGHCDIGIVPRVPYWGPGVSSRIYKNI